MPPKSTNSNVKMSKKEFREEHTNLVRILRSGSQAERVREATKQKRELK